MQAVAEALGVDDVDPLTCLA
ncbi:MAG: hypothetical protein QOJ80_3516, partial [Mycobacterium sp.]|nr:hypothetical protein [Mycobacterium sp.]